MIAPVEIVGIGSSLPERVVTNVDMEKIVDTNDAWISKRTGISTRRIATEERALDLGTDAAKKALERSGLDKNDIGLIVVSTITNDYVTPAMASYIQREIDIDYCASMDISTGCSGFIFALTTAASLMDTLGVDAAIVVASETLAKHANWSDRSTCVLFGDGAGAVVLKRSDKPCVHFPILESIPDREHVIVCRRELLKTPFHDPDFEDPNLEPEYLFMNGAEVFTYAANAAESVLTRLLEMCGDKPYTKIIPHQANEKIIDYIKRKMGFEKEQFFLNIGKYANTSSASIPIAMTDAYAKGWLKKGDRIALVGFGAGLSHGGVVIDWTL